MGPIVNVTPRPLYPRERPGSHCVGGWVGPSAGLDGCGKSHHPTPSGFDPWTVLPEASRLKYRIDVNVTSPYEFQMHTGTG
jgi:hypothetical protein